MLPLPPPTDSLTFITTVPVFTFVGGGVVGFGSLAMILLSLAGHPNTSALFSVECLRDLLRVLMGGRTNGGSSCCLNYSQRLASAEQLEPRVVLHRDQDV